MAKFGAEGLNFHSKPEERNSGFCLPWGEIGEQEKEGLEGSERPFDVILSLLRF
jgi:hypothetical protein